MKKFRFNYIEHPKMAKLAWGMIFTKDSLSVDVHLGSYVETNDNFFVSGVWDGEFSEGGFYKAEFMCGSGAQITPGGVLVSTASHERERVCYCKKGEKLYFSNSIPLLLAMSNMELDKNFYEYEKSFCSIMDGIDEYEQEVILKNDNSMFQIFFSNLYVDHDLNIKSTLRNRHEQFKNFDDYYCSLEHTIANIKDNAQDKNRKIKFGMVTTVSSGYDSCAAAAVAKDVGCDNAITFGGAKYKVDSGVLVAQQMGYSNIIERDVSEYKNKKGILDAIALANGEQGSELEFTVFDKDMKDRLVFVGTNGDHAWGIDTLVSDNFGRDKSFPYYQACLAHAEFALFNGHISIPVPLYGCSAYPSIHAISVSDEMEPWRLHNEYDRPIPRRIVESYGVDRALFGQNKRGGGSSFSKNFTDSQLKNKMTYEGYENFHIWMSKKGISPWSIKRRIDYMIYHIGMFPEYMTYLNYKLFKGKLPIHCIEKRQKVVNPGLPSRLIIWGIETTRDMYKDAMR